MKFIKTTFLLFFLFAIQFLFAQEKPYDAMIFRSQIFNTENQPVKNKNILVVVELYTDNDKWYTEEQEVNTNDEGFVFIPVGKGTNKQGTFSEIPFNTKEINLRIKYKLTSVDGRNSNADFTELESTALYAVPYAFHALTAGSLSNEDDPITQENIESNSTNQNSNTPLASKGKYWSVYGNRDINMRDGFLGSVDSSPLNFKTNNETRMLISPNGTITFYGDISLGSQNQAYIANLTTDNLDISNANLTNLNAQTGQIQSTAQSNDINTGAFTVLGGVGIKKNVNIGENLKVAGNTNLEGQLQVNGNTNFSNNVDIQNKLKVNDNTESYSLNDGSIVTQGGAAINKNLNVGGNINAVGSVSTSENLTVDKITTINSSANSTTKDNGALVLTNGGLGVEKDIVTGGSLRTNGNVISDNNLLVSNTSNLNTLNVSGVTTLSNNTFSNNPNQGALVVNGGVGVGQNLNVAQNTNVAGNLNVGQTTTTNNLTIGDQLAINGAQDAVNQDSGALVVTNGGLGVEKNIYSGKDVIANRDVKSTQNIVSQKDAIVAENLSVGLNASTGSLNVTNNTTIGGNTSVAGLASITNNTASNSATTGALVVNGGVGVGQNLNVAQNTNVAGNLNVGQTTTTNNLTIGDQLAINGAQDAVNQDSGALVVTNGGLGVEKNIYSGKDIIANRDVKSTQNIISQKDAIVAENLSVGLNASAGSLNVTNNTTIGGNTTVSGLTSITNNTTSNSSSTGALVVNGGVGVGQNLNVAQNTNVAGNLNITGTTTLTDNLFSNKVSTFSDKVIITSTLDETVNKALQVDGGVAIGKKLHVKSTLNQPFGDFTDSALKVDGGAIISGNLSVLGEIFAAGASLRTLTPMSIDTYTYYSNPYQRPLLQNKGFGPANSFDSYALGINATHQGIAIKINENPNQGQSLRSSDFSTQSFDLPLDENNSFMTFMDTQGNVKGSIKAQTVEELYDSERYMTLQTKKDITLEEKDAFHNLATETRVIEGIDTAIQILKTLTFGAAELSQETNFGATGILSAASVAAGAKVAGYTAEAFQIGLKIASLVTSAEKYDILESTRQENIDVINNQMQSLVDNVGVTYNSGNGDYAEYLELENANDSKRITWSQVVGVKGGKISLNTNDADKLMVVSMAPIVLGKTPAKDEDINKFKPVAFMGQVPVRVLNETKTGDYILPSGNNDGLSMSKNKKDMTIEDYKNIVGVAWENSRANGLCNVVVGFNSNDIATVIGEQSKKLNDLENRLTALEKMISKDINPTANLVADVNEANVVSIDSETSEKNDIFQKMIDEFRKDASLATNLSDLKNNFETKYPDCKEMKNIKLYAAKEVNSYFQNAFNQNFSIEKSDRNYLNLYKELLVSYLSGEVQ